MSVTLEGIEEKLLSLPEESREKLAYSLLDSLPAFPGALEEGSPELAAELDRRTAEIKNGTAQLVPLEDVMRQIDSILSQR